MTQRQASAATRTRKAARTVPEVELRLYIAGATARSTAAVANLRRICAEHLGGRYRLVVIDLLEHPQQASSDQILAVPTLVRKLPLPVRQVIGDLSNTDRVLVGLDVRPCVAPGAHPKTGP